jgi:hypothetical protein
MSLHLLRLMIYRSRLRRKKTGRKKRAEAQRRRRKKGRNIPCGEEDGPAYTTISTRPFAHSFRIPLTPKSPQMKICDRTVLLVNEQDHEVFPICILEVGMEKRADIGRASHLMRV